MQSPTHFSATAPRQLPAGYSVTVLEDDGRTAIVSTLPARSRNAAIVAAWTLYIAVRAAQANPQG